MPRDRWPSALPAVRQLLDEGLELGPATVLVGENGSGRSTLIEAIAGAFGLSPEGGSTGANIHTRVSESPLWEHLSIARAPGGARRGFFLRAETMPILARLAGARILELGEWGIRESAWEDLALVRNWRLFLEAPERYLRHLD